MIYPFVEKKQPIPALHRRVSGENHPSMIISHKKAPQFSLDNMFNIRAWTYKNNLI